MAFLAELALFGDLAFFAVAVYGLWIVFLLAIVRGFLNMFGDYGWRLLGFFTIILVPPSVVAEMVGSDDLLLGTLIACLLLSGWICWGLGWADDIIEALWFLAVAGVPLAVILGLLHWFKPHLLTWTPMVTVLIISFCFCAYSTIYHWLTRRVIRSSRYP